MADVGDSISFGNSYTSTSPLNACTTLLCLYRRQSQLKRFRNSLPQRATSRLTYIWSMLMKRVPWPNEAS